MAMTLRELRMWHWRKAVAAFIMKRDKEKARDRIGARRCDDIGVFHQSAVDALNKVVTGNNADIDCINDDQRKAAKIEGKLCYFAHDGTMMNIDGTRSVFDDVDE